jgi:hypothetical protein
VNTRRAQAWAWWLLPFLVARALLPTGFMAQAQNGQLNLVLCSAGFAKLDRTNRAESITRSVSQDELAHQGSSQADVICPFALSGSAALAHVVPFFVAHHSVAIEDAVSPRLPILSVRLANAHRVRGPPQFS